MEFLKIQLLQKDQTRSINWYEHTIQSLAHQFPELKPVTSQMTHRLSTLLLERLPDLLRNKLLSLLPEDILKEFSESVELLKNSPPETSISYLDFADRVGKTLGCANLKSFDFSSISESEVKKITEKIADTFLWAIAQDFPPDLKTRLIENLPSDLRSRMDLLSSHSDESKVA